MKKSHANPKGGNFKKFMFALVLLCFGITLFVLVYALSMGSTTVVKKLSDATEEHNPMKKNYYNGIFRIQEIKFFERELAQIGVNKTYNFSAANKSLCKREKEYLILELLLNNKKMPVKCEVLVDKRIAKEVKTSELFDLKDSPTNESLMPINLGLQKVDAPHKIKVCCDNFCQEESFQSDC